MFPTAERDVWWPELNVKPRVSANGAVAFWRKNSERDNSIIAHPKSSPVCLDYRLTRCCRLFRHDGIAVMETRLSSQEQTSLYTKYFSPAVYFP